VCGYSKCLAALDFHHRESEDKEFSVGQMFNRSWAAIEQELEKCTLLCRNCHAELHSLAPLL
jgi:hypothetical protein